MMDGSAPPLRGKDILVAVEDCERLERILAGHDLTFPKSVDQAKAELQKRKFAMIVVRRIIDYPILIDGDMLGGFEAAHEKR